jgi:DHA2 family multidrug resistance protein
MPRSPAGPHNPWLIAVVVSLATFMEVLDTSIANVSLRHIAGNLSVSYDESTWVLTSYLIANAIILPISGWLAGVFGRKRFYLGCVALFTASSFCCGLAPSLGWLVVFRVIQGLGGGGLAPSALSMLRDSFPEEKTGMVYALYGVVVVAAPALGPTLGGYLTDAYSWHWVFLINVPVGIIALTLSGMLLVEPEIERREREARWARGLRIDYAGFLLVAVGLGALQIVLDKGERDDWFNSTFIVVMSAIAVTSLIALVIRELSIEEPIVDLPLLRNRNFLAANLVRFGTFVALLGTTQLIPELVQTQLGYTAMQAGLVITPGAFVVIAMMPMVGKAVNRIQPRYMIAAGLVLEALALFHMSGFNTEMGFWHVAWARCFQAAGLGLLIVPITSVAYIGIAGNKSNNASALINLSRNIGGSFGIALAQTWLARRTLFHQSRLGSHLTRENPRLQQMLEHAADRFVAAGSSVVEANRQALAALHGIVLRQARMIAFNDVFYVMAIGCLVTLPLVLLLKRARPGH